MLVTILGTLKQTQTLDELLPSMLQMEQQIRADERETVPIYGAKDGMRRKQPRQNQQRNSRSDRPRFQGSCHYCSKKGHMESECRTRNRISNCLARHPHSGIWRLSSRGIQR